MYSNYTLSYYTNKGRTNRMLIQISSIFTSSLYHIEVAFKVLYCILINTDCNTVNICYIISYNFSYGIGITNRTVLTLKSFCLFFIFHFSIFFQSNLCLTIYANRSANQTIRMKCQTLFAQQIVHMKYQVLLSPKIIEM